ncbi:hypothetical protein H0H81_008899, partial [Sphagnurus paluster]
MRIAQSTRDADKIKDTTTSKGLWDALKESSKLIHNKDPIPQINELSAVKRQKLNPQWNSTRSSDQAPKPHNQQGQKKQRGGKNHKGKGKAQQTHIASSGVIPDAGS